MRDSKSDDGTISSGEAAAGATGADDLESIQRKRCQYLRQLSEGIKYQEDVRRRYEGLDPLFELLLESDIDPELVDKLDGSVVGEFDSTLVGVLVATWLVDIETIADTEIDPLVEGLFELVVETELVEELDGSTVYVDIELYVMIGV